MIAVVTSFILCLPPFMDEIKSFTEGNLDQIKTIKIIEVYDLVRSDAEVDDQRALDAQITQIARFYDERVQRARDSGALSAELLDQIGEWRDRLIKKAQRHHMTIRAERRHLSLRRTTCADLKQKKARVESVDARDLDALAARHQLSAEERWNLDETITWVYTLQGAVWWKPNVPGNRHYAAPQCYDDEFMRLRLGFLPAWVFDGSQDTTWVQDGDAIVGESTGVTRRFEFRPGSYRVGRLTITYERGLPATTYELENWRVVEGVLLPHNLTVSQAGKRHAVHIVTEYEVNPPIGEDKFAAPAASVRDERLLP